MKERLKERRIWGEECSLLDFVEASTIQRGCYCIKAVCEWLQGKKSSEAGKSDGQND